VTDDEIPSRTGRWQLRPLPLRTDWCAMNQIVVTTQVVTFEYDEEGRVIRQVTETVVRTEDKE
jgi:hypothetical protein